MENMMTVVDIDCPYCGKEYTITVPIKGFQKWKNGMSIQHAMPELSAKDRESLISGICPKCWEETFLS